MLEQAAMEHTQDTEDQDLDNKVTRYLLCWDYSVHSSKCIKACFFYVTYVIYFDFPKSNDSASCLFVMIALAIRTLPGPTSPKRKQCSI